MRAALLVLAVISGCTPPPLELEVSLGQAGLEVRSTRPLHRVELTDAEGAPVVGRTLPTPSSVVHLTAPLRAGGSYIVTGLASADRATAPLDVPASGPVRVEVEAPAGQGRRTLVDGDLVEVVRVGDGAVDVGLQIVARVPGPVVIEIDGEREGVDLRVVGQQHTARLRLVDDAEHLIRIEAGGEQITARLVATVRSMEQAREALAVVDVAFPADGVGHRDRARPSDRITLPARWWRDGLRGLNLGYRPLDEQAPWAWQTVTLENADPDPLSVLVRAEVVDPAGAPVAAFRPRVRDHGGTAVSALLRVPGGGRATAVLPVYVEGDALSDDGAYRRVIDIIPLGASEPLHRVERPLYVTRGSPLASSGFLLALLASIAGYLALGLRWRRWLIERRTSELVTVALFASLTFVVGAAFQALGIGMATFLGPFAPLLTGLFEDALRACLLGTLVTLVPRPGVVSLATVVGFLLRALALGSVHPVDLLYVGSAVFFLESALWSTGCTRLEAWRDEPRWKRWLRLGLGLGLANVCATATALVVSVVLYRLYFAAWYVALVLALPGFLYVLIGSWIAVDFASALRRVEP